MVQYPKLLIFEGKDSKSYYLLTSNEDLHRASVAELKKRDQLGYFYDSDGDGLHQVEKDGLDAIRKSDNPQDLTIKVYGKNQNLAFFLIKSRHYHEYEGYTFAALYSIPTVEELRDI